MRKTHAVVFLILISFAGCKNQQIFFNIKDEAAFARAQNNLFVVDYMESKADVLLGRGWSKLRPRERSRLGAYPDSLIRFNLFTIEPLYLFLECKPFPRDNIPAKEIGIRINQNEPVSVKLREYMSKHLEIPLPEKFLKTGMNTIEFSYAADPIQEKKGLSSKKKGRDFSVIFYDLVLSSSSDFNLAQTFTDMRSKIFQDSPEIFIQNVPSTVDFFLDIPSQSSLEARYTFIPLPGKDQDKELELVITFQNPESEEQNFPLQTLQAEKANKFQLDPIPLSGITRLSLQAGRSQQDKTLEGFLVWTDMRIKGKKPKKKEKKVGEDFKRWKEFLSDKNTVLVIMDAARADHFSCYGYFRPTTPNLEKFAQHSILFTQAFTEALTTRPSIGTLFTGFPLTVNSLRKITSKIPEDLVTLAQMFDSIGFKTTGFAGVGNVSSDFGFNKGFDEYFDLYREEDFHRKSQQYLPYIIPWLEAHRDRNFFLYIHFKEPHGVYVPLPPFLGMFSDKYPEKVDLGKHRLRDIADQLTDGQIEYVKAAYDENLASVDSVIGQIIEKMDALGLTEQSILIFTADHGELMGEHNRLFGHGGYFGEGGIHIPLIIRFPGQERKNRPEKIHGLVKLSDLFATLADIYGFDIPQELMGGKSILPLVFGLEQEVNTFVIIEKIGIPGYCYRTKNHKLIYWEKSAATEFYNLKKDPEAKTNIYTIDNVRANFYLTELKKWIVEQEFIQKLLLKGDSSRREIEYRLIDKTTIENLKALGYIK
jgi:arylsulfatase A-like enzyme